MAQRGGAGGGTAPFVGVARQPQPGRGSGTHGNWTVPRLWPGSTVVCIASGPSLTPADIERVRIAHADGRCRVITINGWLRPGGGCVLNAPFADILYAADATWWRSAQNAPGFRGLKVSLEDIEFRDVRRLKHDKQQNGGLSFDPSLLHTGGNSGYQSVNLAMLLGAKRIVLLGYDMKAGAHGQKHHHPDHAGRNPTGAAQFKGWVAAFATMAPDLAKAGVEILNCSRETALDMFPRAKLEDIL